VPNTQNGALGAQELYTQTLGAQTTNRMRMAHGSRRLALDPCGPRRCSGGYSPYKYHIPNSHILIQNEVVQEEGKH